MSATKFNPSNAFSNGGSLRQRNGLLYLLTDILDESMQEYLDQHPGTITRKFDGILGLLIGTVPSAPVKVRKRKKVVVR